jgi:succinyl-diaminopimelate desuccinylase
MKGSLAAMVVACERFVRAHPDHRGSIAMLVTSDEEGPAQDGTARVMEQLGSRAEHITWCLIGEPSSQRRLGDTVKNGRRGSLHGHLKFHGVQGHVAYPHLAHNPIHGIGRLIARLSDQTWDHGDEHFPPTSFQISNIWSGTGATNVIPGALELQFNFRFGTESSAVGLMRRVEEMIDRHVHDEESMGNGRHPYELEWHLSGEPFLTPTGALLESVLEAVHAVLGYAAEPSTSGGTSDGRFIRPTGAQVIELGPVNTTIHKVNERVRVQDLDRLTEVYTRVLVNLLVTRGDSGSAR